MKKKRVLVCVLNWGLGHAARCVPVIEHLTEAGFEVFIGSDGAALTFLKREFAALTFFELPGYNISYPANGNITFSMLLQSPKIISAIKKENDVVEKIIEENEISCMISDNRYGCYSEKIKSVFITHQLNIQAPVGAQFIVNKINSSFLKKFNEIWVPDVEEENNLSGDLSHKHHFENVYYIGMLSRFNKSSIPEEKNFRYKFMVLLSGPEPQRSILEKELLKEAEEISEPVLFVRGLLEDKEHLTSSSTNIRIKNFLKGDELVEAFAESEIVICRSGYSTIMDLAALNKKAVLIPTPGQTEQEYLADYFQEKKIFLKNEQGSLNLKEAADSISLYSGVFLRNNFTLLKERISSL